MAHFNPSKLANLLDQYADDLDKSSDLVSGDWNQLRAGWHRLAALLDAQWVDELEPVYEIIERTFQDYDQKAKSLKSNIKGTSAKLRLFDS